MKRTVLIIDDDKLFCDAASQHLGTDNIEVSTAHTKADGLRISSNQRVDVIVLDQKLPDGDGHLLCPDLLNYNEQAKIIFITAFPTFENALQAIKAGAHDYLSKPIDPNELRLAVEQAFRMLDLEKIEVVQSYKTDRERQESIIIGDGLKEIRNIIDLASSSDAPVLITGETGTGKTLVARAIHYRGPRKKSPFISINCAALPENLVESELFGYEKGAFSGAVSSRKGIFEVADGGTLLLDEIGSMPLHLQSKLLTAIEDKAIKRLGSDSIRHVDVRIITATNRNIEEAVKDKSFRVDLYYRLNVIRIHIPPLRERTGDIKKLCEHLLSEASTGRKYEMPEDEMKRLMKYSWPGNVRELKNIMERMVVLQKGPVLMPSKLLETSTMETPDAGDAFPGEEEIQSLDEMEKQYIKKALLSFAGNYTRTSQALGISLSTLKRKLKSYGL